jgi:hypothetical protein
MSNEKPDLNALVSRGKNVETAAKPDAESKPTPIDLSSVGGVLIASPTAGSEPVDLSDLYGEHGGLLLPATAEEVGNDESGGER